jgi:hypothetical protein
VIPAWRALADGSINNEFGYRTQGQTELASLYPGAVLLNDKTVGLRTSDLLSGYLAYRALASYTILEHYRWIVETVQDFEDGDTILRRVGEQMSSAQMTFEPTGAKPEFSIFAKHGSK